MRAVLVCACAHPCARTVVLALTCPHVFFKKMCACCNLAPHSLPPPTALGTPCNHTRHTHTCYTHMHASPRTAHYTAHTTLYMPHTTHYTLHTTHTPVTEPLVPWCGACCGSRRYPSIVPRATVDRWTAPTFRGSYVTDPAIVSANPARSSGSGSGGRSGGRSFGGGSSWGGGGGGGSW